MAGSSMDWLIVVTGVTGAVLAVATAGWVVLRRSRRHPNSTLEMNPRLVIDDRAGAYLPLSEQPVACAYVHDDLAEVTDRYVVLTTRDLWWFRFASTEVDQPAIVWAMALSLHQITALEVDESAGATRIAYDGGDMTWRWSPGTEARKLMRALIEAGSQAAGTTWAVGDVGAMTPERVPGRSFR
jgi:hypothetical protein